MMVGASTGHMTKVQMQSFLGMPGLQTVMRREETQQQHMSSLSPP